MSLCPSVSDPRAKALPQGRTAHVVMVTYHITSFSKTMSPELAGAVFFGHKIVSIIDDNILIRYDFGLQVPWPAG